MAIFNTVLYCHINQFNLSCMHIMACVTSNVAYNKIKVINTPETYNLCGNLCNRLILVIIMITPRY